VENGNRVIRWFSLSYCILLSVWPDSLVPRNQHCKDTFSHVSMT